MSEYLLPFSGKEISDKLISIDNMVKVDQFNSAVESLVTKDLMNENVNALNERIDELNNGTQGGNKDCDISGNASGNHIIISDSSDAPLLGFDAEYETSKYKGYQLFDSSKLKTPTNGSGYTKNADGSINMGGAKITINDSDGSITIEGSGAITGDGFIEYKYPHAEKLALVRGGDFYSNYNTTSFPYVTFFIRAWGQYYTLDNSLECQKTFNHSQDSLNYEQVELKIAICAEKGSVITPCTVKPMIYQDGDGTWEPFTNRQPVNIPLTVNVYGGNFIDYDSWKDVEPVNGTAEYINNGVKLTATSNDCYTQYSPDNASVLKIEELSGNQCTLSWKFSGNDNDTVHIFNAGVSELASTNSVNEKLQFTVPDDCKFITFKVGCHTAGNTAIYEDIMLNIGLEPLPHEPYKKKQSVSIDNMDESNVSIQQLHSYFPTTTILNNYNANMEVEYFKNTQNGECVGKIFKENVELKSELAEIKELISGLTSTTLANEEELAEGE